MQVDFAFICDYAEAKDKINALGIGFSRIYAKKMPARHAHFSLVAQLKFIRIEAGTKKVQVNLIDADGASIIPPINTQLEVKPPPQGVLESKTRLVMEFGNVEFKKYGDYSIRLNMDGQEIVSIPLVVTQPSPPPATA